MDLKQCDPVLLSRNKKEEQPPDLRGCSV